MIKFSLSGDRPGKSNQSSAVPSASKGKVTSSHLCVQCACDVCMARYVCVLGPDEQESFRTEANNMKGCEIRKGYPM